MRHSDTHLIKADGTPNVASRCYKNGSCSFGFPRPLSEHTTVDPTTERIVYKRTNAEECMTAQYPPLILLAWEGHAHIDFSLSLESFVYMFKYIHKGPDHVDFRFRDEDVGIEEAASAVVDDFIRARYLSATEAYWRIFGFDLTSKSPTVSRLGVHTQGSNRAQFRGSNAPGSDASTLIRYMLRPAAFAHMLYTEYAEQTTSAASTEAQRQGRVELPPNTHLERTEPGQRFLPKLIKLRQRGECVARIKTVRPGSGEVFYIRQILLNKPVSSWIDMRTVSVGGNPPVRYETYQAAATAMGLFEGTDEAHLAMQDAIDEHQPPSQLRFLFAIVVVDGAIATRLWDSFEQAMIRDYLPPGVTEPTAEHQLLAEQAGRIAIARLFHELGHNASSFGLPDAEERSAEVDEELRCFRPRLHQLSVEAARSRLTFNAEQHQLYDDLLRAVAVEDSPKLHLIQGKAGRGKTYVIHAVLNHLRSTERVVAVSGATGLCASAFERGATVHRLFDIPVQDPTLGIPLVSRLELGKRRTEYLAQVDAIIIDEVWALGRAVIEAVDAVMRIITGVELPFGGKPVFAIGDPRQTAPVVPGAGKAQILEHSFLSSALFPHFQLHELLQPVRNADDPLFADWVDTIGSDITNSDITLSKYFATTASLDEARLRLFPPYITEDPSAAARRAFLSPFNANVRAFNDSVLEHLPGAQQTILSFDTIKGDVDDDEEPLAAPELLNDLDGSGVPYHQLNIKPGALCVLMRNLHPAKGLVRNCKVVVRTIKTHIVIFRKLDDPEPFVLPRIVFEFQPASFPFMIVRKQIPLRLAYALTFHGCQGATLDKTVVDCRLPVFAHGQRYASVSRYRHRSDTLALIQEETIDVEHPQVVNNIFYPEFIEVAAI